jgi:hypothetical protein
VRARQALPRQLRVERRLDARGAQALERDGRGLGDQEGRVQDAGHERAVLSDQRALGRLARGRRRRVACAGLG